MSDIYQALQDVNWLADRLKGLIALSEEIETYDTLKSQTVDLQKALDQTKNDYNAASDELTAVNASITKAKLDSQIGLKDIQNKCAAAVSAANAQADDIRQSAEADAAALRQELSDEEKAMADKISTAAKSLTDTYAQIATATTVLNELQSEIANIKAKF